MNHAGWRELAVFFVIALNLRLAWWAVYRKETTVRGTVLAAATSVLILLLGIAAFRFNITLVLHMAQVAIFTKLAIETYDKTKNQAKIS